MEVEQIVKSVEESFKNEDCKEVSFINVKGDLDTSVKFYDIAKLLINSGYVSSYDSYKIGSEKSSGIYYKLNVIRVLN